MKQAKTIDYYLALPYRLEIISDTAEGGYGARYLELPGCITCGETLEDVTRNVEDANHESISMNQYCMYLLSRNDALRMV